MGREKEIEQHRQSAKHAQSYEGWALDYYRDVTWLQSQLVEAREAVKQAHNAWELKYNALLAAYRCLSDELESEVPSDA